MRVALRAEESDTTLVDRESMDVLRLVTTVLETPPVVPPCVLLEAARVTSESLVLTTAALKRVTLDTRAEESCWEEELRRLRLVWRPVAAVASWLEVDALSAVSDPCRAETAVLRGVTAATSRVESALTRLAERSVTTAVVLLTRLRELVRMAVDKEDKTEACRVESSPSVALAKPKAAEVLETAVRRVLWSAACRELAVPLRVSRVLKVEADRAPCRVWVVRESSVENTALVLVRPAVAVLSTLVASCVELLLTPATTDASAAEASVAEARMAADKAEAVEAVSVERLARLLVKEEAVAVRASMRLALTLRTLVERASVVLAANEAAPKSCTEKPADMLDICVCS